MENLHIGDTVVKTKGSREGELFRIEEGAIHKNNKWVQAPTGYRHYMDAVEVVSNHHEHLPIFIDNKYLSKAFQNLLFDNGWQWPTGKKVQFAEEDYLYLKPKSKIIMYSKKNLDDTKYMDTYLNLRHNWENIEKFVATPDVIKIKEYKVEFLPEECIKVGCKTINSQAITHAYHLTQKLDIDHIRVEGIDIKPKTIKKIYNRLKDNA